MAVDDETGAEVIRATSRLIGQLPAPAQMVVNKMISAPLLRVWGNPLLQNARRERPMPVRRLAPVLGISTGVALAVSVAAWVAGWRAVGAALVGMSLTPAIIAVLAAAPLGAGRIARHMHSADLDPRRLADLSPRDATDGLALATLWDLRWLLAAMLALTPTLIVGMLHLDIAEFSQWRESALALGPASPIARTGWLLPDGSIPYFRLILRAASAGGLVWALLPLVAALGVTSALALRDVTLSQLAALLGGALTTGMVGLIWEAMNRTPLMAGGLEALRLAVLIGLLAATGAATGAIQQVNARLLAAGRSHRSR